MDTRNTRTFQLATWPLATPSNPIPLEGLVHLQMPSKVRLYKSKVGYFKLSDFKRLIIFLSAATFHCLATPVTAQEVWWLFLGGVY